MRRPLTLLSSSSRIQGETWEDYLVPNESTAQVKRPLCRGIPLNMPRVTTDVPPQAAALQGIGHQKSTSRNRTRQGDLPKKHGDAFIAVAVGFIIEPPGALLAVSPPPFKVNFRNSRFRLFIVSGTTDRGTWEDRNSLSSVIHVLDLAQLFVNAADCTMDPATLSRSRRSQQKTLVPFFVCCCFQWVPLLPLRAISANRTTRGSIRIAPVARGDPCEKRNLNKKQGN